MRINIPFQVMNSSGFVARATTMKGALYLREDITIDLEAVTKQYVDLKLKNLHVNDFSTGVIKANRLGVFAGDLLNLNGVINLTTTGVSPGRLVKVNVDSKGRVIGNGGLLTANDIPSLNWNKITSGKPTTLEGYNINEVLNKNGDTLTGPLLSTSNPFESRHIVNRKQSLEIIGGYRLVTGDIIQKTTPETPAGFLKCNGGIVSKSMYSELYSVIGGKFNTTSTHNNAEPWYQQYTFNLENNLPLGTWTKENNSTLNHDMYPIFQIKNRIYQIGGGTAYNIYYMEIDSTGNIGEWTLLPNRELPVNPRGGRVVIINDYIHFIGGAGNLNTYYSKINSDASLGPWLLGTTIPASITSFKTLLTKNKVYTLGGNNSTNAVFVAPILENNLIGAWSVNPSLPVARTMFTLAVTRNRVHVIGGHLGGTGDVIDTYSAPITPDGSIGVWSRGTNLPSVLGASQMLICRDKIISFGGRTFPNKISNIYAADINKDGQIGTWSRIGNLPVGFMLGECFVTSSKLYLLGSPDKLIYSIPFKGGKNDYSDYYKLDTEDNTSPLFNLPDIPLDERCDINSFIKY